MSWQSAHEGFVAVAADAQIVVSDTKSASSAGVDIQMPQSQAEGDDAWVHVRNLGSVVVSTYDDGSFAAPGDDQPLLADDLHGKAYGGSGDAELLLKRYLGQHCLRRVDA
jgi:hypothetical protein